MKKYLLTKCVKYHNINTDMKKLVATTALITSLGFASFFVTSAFAQSSTVTPTTTSQSSTVEPTTTSQSSTIA